MAFGDPLLAYEPMPHSRVYLPLGFAVKIETNDPALLDIVNQSWASAEGSVDVVAKLRLGVRACGTDACPPSPHPRGHGHLFTTTADAENFIACDLRENVAFGWLTTAALAHPSYLRYCLVEAAVYTMLAAHHVTPLHTACVTSEGRGLLLAGDSGAGKSTLAYACARAGFAYTSDDCSYLLREDDALRVFGNCRQFRFRPSAQALFPELAGRAVTPRIEGKPSIEVPTAELAGIHPVAEAQVHAVVLLKRCEVEGAALTPVTEEEVRAYWEASLFPMPFVHELQRPSLERLAGQPVFRMRYRDLDPAIAALRSLARELPL